MKKQTAHAVIYTAINGERAEVLFRSKRHAERAQEALAHVGACILGTSDVLTCRPSQGVIVEPRELFS